MNLILMGYDTVIDNEDGTQTYDKVNVKDNVYGQYTFTHVSVGNKIYGYGDTDDGEKVFAIGIITKKVSGRRGKSSITVKIIEPNDKIVHYNTVYGCFICDTENYIDDIPSGFGAGFDGNITELARTYNLTHQPKYYVDIIKVSDIITDETATDKTKKHYATLQHTPIEDDVVYMEINGVNYYEKADDMEIDRETKRIYFDTQDDDFSFDDLKNSVDTIRVFYHYIN